MSDDLGTASPTVEGPRPGPASDTSKLLAAFGYVIWIVALVAILIEPYKNEGFVKFHGYQALGFGLAMTIISFIAGVVPVIGWVVAMFLPIVWLVLGIMYALKANKGEYFEVPVVYGFVKGYM